MNSKGKNLNMLLIYVLIYFKNILKSPVCKQCLLLWFRIERVECVDGGGGRYYINAAYGKLCIIR